ncbi:hypothetical protein F5Y17DRAFT_459707 [Xylariaceae sp. FL0594]|nr:hypothetical protein F5Y17DRAFT_459707 [Xylariaceae sp. FL0594]
MAVRGELMSCVVERHDGKLVLPQPFSAANFTVAGVRTIDSANRGQSLKALSAEWTTPSLKLNDCIFCKTNGAEVANTSTLTDYLEYTGQELATGAEQPKDRTVVIYLLIVKIVQLVEERLDAILTQDSATVTFHLIGAPAASSPPGPAAGPSQKQSRIGIGALLKSCGPADQPAPEWKNVTMGMIKTAMVTLGLAREFEIWDSPQSKLLDYNVLLRHYCLRVWNHSHGSDVDSKLVVYYGLKKDHDQQTVQQVYRSMEFLIKFYQLKEGEPLPVGSVRVKEKPGDTTEKDVIAWSTLETAELSSFRAYIRTMSQLPSKHHFCLPDGSPVVDTTTFAGYVELLDEACAFVNSTPSIGLRFQEVQVESKWKGGAKALEAIKAMSINPKLTSDDRMAPLIATGAVDYLAKDKLDLNGAAVTALSGLQMGANPLSIPSMLDEIQWGHVMQNCHVMHGWYLDEYTNQIKMAPKPAFRLRKNLNMLIEEASSTSSKETLPVSKEAGGDLTAPAPSITPLPRRSGAAWSKPNAIPTFQVNDGTKIDIVTVEDETKQSFVLKSFEKSSTEATVSGGYGGVGVGISGGFASESQKGSSKETKKFMSRVTVMLQPEDLEATEELTREVENIRDKQNTMDVRKFYKKFGQFFAQEVRLGGVLTSTRVIDATETTAQEKSKDSFKLAIGLSVTMPIDAGVEVEHEKTVGSEKSDTNGQKHVNDRVVFEATGGNTILAASPHQWCVSVGDHLNWRVIERSDLQPIIRTIADCSTAGFDDASEWFFRAAPSNMTELIDIPQSMELLAQIRFRAANEDDRPQYLLHQANTRITIKVKENTISPAEFQGPRISPYEKQNWLPRDGIWVITPRNKGMLLDGSSVSIRTSHDLSTRRYLGVIRTSGDFFVPCISTSGHTPIWTIRKAPKGDAPLPDAPSGKPLKDKDIFCLTFDFANNGRGYRDFFGDDRGYRRRDYPQATNNRLLLTQLLSTDFVKGNTLVMADEAMKDGAVARSIRVHGEDYFVDIATFTMDLLASDGTDEDTDILLLDGDTIKRRDDEMRKQLLQAGQVQIPVDTVPEPAPKPA